MSSLIAPADLLSAATGAVGSDAAANEMLVTFGLLTLGYLTARAMKGGRRMAARPSVAPAAFVFSESQAKESDRASSSTPIDEMSTDEEDFSSDLFFADEADSSTDIDDLASTEVYAFVEGAVRAQEDERVDAMQGRWLEASLSALDDLDAS